MLGRRVIGVDMGGTKLLAGVVDETLAVHHRSQRVVAGLDQPALLDLCVEAVQEVRAQAGREVAAVGFGIPSLIDRRTGKGVLAVNLPLADIPFASVMAERLGLPVVVDNDANGANGHYELINLWTAENERPPKVLDANSTGLGADGTKVQLWDRLGPPHTNQHWSLDVNL